MIDSSPPDAKPSPFAPILWAIFLGCSWTWVIGMFLPVLLVRDYGIWGWVVFAVPNVAGAAAMGWVLRDRAASERFVQRHANACYAFSLVTIAYHVFFATWMIERLRGWGLIAIGIFILAWLVSGRDVGRWTGACVALFISLAMWWLLYRQHGMLRLPTGPSGESIAKAAWLLPAFVLGFGLCPYLDLTFHRARQATTPAGGRFAFGVGFGLVFCGMIVFSLLYARWVAAALEGLPLSRLASLYLCIHIVTQSAFTVAVHARELPWKGKSFATLLAVALLAAVLGWATSMPQRIRGLDAGEIVYWCFLGFYGLVFPAYLWLTGREQSRTPILLLATCVAVAFPMYWMAFVEGQPWWLVPGVLVILAGRLLVRRS